VRSTLRLCAVLAALAVPIATRALITARAAAIPSFDLAHLPDQLGPLALSSQEELPADVLAQISPDAHALRLYTDDQGAGVWAYLAFYSGTGAKGAHDPEVCYPAQGWDIATLRSREVALADGKSLTGRLLAAKLGGQEELVLYWFQPVGRWPRPSPLELALRGLDALAGRSRYAFVRLSTRVAAADAAQQRTAEDRLVDAARALAPAVRATVDAS
jgi:EpsI family protein